MIMKAVRRRDLSHNSCLMGAGIQALDLKPGLFMDHWTQAAVRQR
jgi:hypothetical protein